MDDTVDYCRQIERYLCQKNGGHLVRIVGPAFEKVRDWAGQGIPLKIAFRGIDRCCERAQARGGRRRPMRIEFCEADIVDTFEDWRRAVGITVEAAETVENAEGASAAKAGTRKGPLVAHIQRTVTRLLAPRGIAVDADYDDQLRRIIEELDVLAVEAKSARDESRASIIDRLDALDRQLLEMARERVDAGTAAALRAEADADLSGFADRMPAEALAQARGRAFERLLRDALNLPIISYD